MTSTSRDANAQLISDAAIGGAAGWWPRNEHNPSTSGSRAAMVRVAGRLIR